MKLLEEEDSSVDEELTCAVPQVTTPPKVIRILSDAEQKLFENFSFTSDWFQQTG